MTGHLTAPSAQPEPLARPTLLPGLRCLWRGPHRLQLGADPARAVILELPEPTTARLLELLDGTRSERAVLADAQRYGIRVGEAHAMLTALRQAGLVVAANSLLPSNLPAPTRHRLASEAAALGLRGRDAPATPARLLRRRAAARVLITGHGPVAAPAAVALATAGVGHVSPQVDPSPTVLQPMVDPIPETPPRPLREQLAEAITQAAPGTQTRPLRRGEATFVVQVGTAGPANLTAAGYARHRLPHLPVTIRDGAVVIGPLVPPTGAPCLNCVDLHRQDRDPEWPQLAAQLATPVADPCAAATVLSAAGLLAGEVLSWLDGETPATLGASIELTAPGRLRRRSWPPHPRCPCYRRHLRSRPRP